MNQLQILPLCLAGWINRNQQQEIEYLQEEVRVLKEQLGKQPRFNDDQRRRLAVKAKKIDPQRLKGLTPLVSPRTLLEWHQRLVARKYDGSAKRAGTEKPWQFRKPRQTGQTVRVSQPEDSVIPNCCPRS